jgi:hypothetical protein
MMVAQFAPNGEAARILEVARQREAINAASVRQIDYARAKREHPKLKAALTRALNAPPTQRANLVILACRKAVREWDQWGCWPDDWSRWQRALDDTLGLHGTVQLGSLR